MLASLVALLVSADCPSGYSKLLDGACLASPKGPAKATLVYLHGMLPPKPEWTKAPEFQRLASEAKRRGVAVLALRGEQGLCQWADDVRDYWCWPCDQSMLPLATRFTDRIARALEASKLKSGPTVIAGFSNGGYFTGMIASELGSEAKGYAIVHAGHLDGEAFDATRWKPTLLVAGKQDPIQLPAMKFLADLLERAKWKATLQINDGKHEFTQADARSVVDFTESLVTPEH